VGGDYEMGKITPEVRQIIDKYQYSRELRKYSNKRFFQDNTFYRRVESNEDVKRAEAGIFNRLIQYKKVFPLVRDDFEDLERATGYFEIAVGKVISCFDNNLCSFNYSEEELQSLIDKVFECHDKLDELAIRKIMQD
jgi:hypothetical protein